MKRYYPKGFNVPHSVRSHAYVRSIARHLMTGGTVPPILCDGENLLAGVHRAAANDLLELLSDRNEQITVKVDVVDVGGLAGLEWGRSTVCGFAHYLSGKYGMSHKVCMSDAWRMLKKCVEDDDGYCDIFCDVENGEELYDLAGFLGWV